MKNEAIIIYLVFVFSMLLSSCAGESKEDAVYKEIIIGNQVWMTENLNVDKFRNGDSILEIKSTEEWRKAGVNQQPAWCYYNNDPDNAEKHFKLYNWYAVNDPRVLAPKGWHIPTKDEWTELINYLGGETRACRKIKNTKGWEGGYNGTNESGFSGIPGGCRKFDGTFSSIGQEANWWSSSEDNIENAFYRSLINDFAFIHTVTYGKANGFSVRCIRD